MKLPDTVIDQAIAWQVLLASGMATDADREACRQWCAAHPDHALAWQRIAGFGNELQQLPSAVTHATLGQGGVSRRTVLRSLALTAGGGIALLAAGTSSWTGGPSLSWRQDQRLATGVGERRHLRLADGSELTLNAESVLNVRFSGTHRLLSLTRGDVFVRTAGQATRDAGPFLVDTAHGSIRALGTRFMVRQRGGTSRVAVYEGAVEVTSPSVAGVTRVPAGYALRLGMDGPLMLEPAGPDEAAWLEGRLVAHSMRLGDLLSELAHYRHGWLRCDDAAAALRVSGVFSLQDSDQALAVLGRTLPVSIRRVGPYWVSVSLA